MTQSIRGLNIIRAYEMSWLNSTGLPQIAVLEIYQDHNQPDFDTWRLKRFLESINNITYIDTATLKTAIKEFLQQNNFVGCDIQIIPQQNFTAIDFTQKPKAEKLPNSITQGLRFICQQTDQPFIGTVSVCYTQEVEDMELVLNDLLLELRNKKFTPQAYAAEIMQRMMQLQLGEFAVVINLNRRGGISQTAIRSNTTVDLRSLAQRGILE